MEDQPDRRSGLDADLAALKRHGWRHLAEHPAKYEVLPGLVTRGEFDLHDGGLIKATGRVRQFLEGALDRIPERRVKDFWKLRLGLAPGSPPSVLGRQRLAATAYAGDDRQPDTSRKEIEPKVTEYLLDALRLQGTSPGPDADVPEALRVFTEHDLHRLVNQLEDALRIAEREVALQRFDAADRILGEILAVPMRPAASAPELNLYARAHYLRGGVYRDQGRLGGTRPAQRAYLTAEAIYRELANSQRQAEGELMRGVLLEMSGKADESLRVYSTLADDTLRLTPLARMRANLWAGSSLTKLGANHEARKRILHSLAFFEHTDSDVTSGNLKLSANLLAARNPQAALDALDEIHFDRHTPPLLVVRRDLARAQALLADPATLEAGLLVLRTARGLAEQGRHGHQLRRAVRLEQQVTAPAHDPSTPRTRPRA